MIVTLRYFVAVFLFFRGCWSWAELSCVYLDDLTDYVYEIIMKTCSYIKRLCRFLTSRMTKIVAQSSLFRDLLWTCKRRWCFFWQINYQTRVRWLREAFRMSINVWEQFSVFPGSQTVLWNFNCRYFCHENLAQSRDISNLIVFFKSAKI